MKDKRTKAELIKELSKEKNDNASLRNTVAGLQSGMTYLNTECDNANDRTQQEKAKTAHFERLFHEQQTHANDLERSLMSLTNTLVEQNQELAKQQQNTESLLSAMRLLQDQIKLYQLSQQTFSKADNKVGFKYDEIAREWKTVKDEVKIAT